MKQNYFTHGAAAILILAAVSSCNRNNNQTKLQYMPDMADSPTVKPQKGFLDPAEDSVSLNSMVYPATPEESEKVLRNPFPANDAVVENGKQLYDTFCVPCHGAGGKGDGSIVDKYVAPPDITTDTYAKRADGFFFYRITFGTTIMPGYGHSISAHERWQIIHYLRTLQQKGGK